jgi:hypothetical protein
MDYLSVELMAPEEELIVFAAVQRPHVACLVQKDGIIRMHIAPDQGAAQRMLFGWLLELDSGFSRAFVRPA